MQYLRGSAHYACCTSGVEPITQESVRDGAGVTAQLADVFNSMRPAGGGRPMLTAADWGGMSAEEMAARMKVAIFRV